MEASIHWVDWVVFAAVLLISLLVGVYQACTGGKQKTSGEYLMGNRKLPFLPVTLSLMVSFISTNSIIGYAAEIYTFGTLYTSGLLGYILGVFLAGYIFVPLFYPLKLVSVNEYLLLRYNSRLVHVVGSFLTVGAAVNYSGVVLYGASAAIEAMSGFSAQWAIILSGIVCTIYTSIGGIKAVIWTDVFQAIIMLAGIIYVTVSGIAASAGISNVISVNKEWKRLKFFDFDPNPTKRLNTYGLIIGEALTCAGVFGYIQLGVQRYTSLPTMKQAKWCLFATIPGHLLTNLLSCLSGLIVFAYYTDAGCDPLRAGYIKSPNHILPYFMATEIGMPVLTGLFLSSLIASSLSTASSSLNASAANTWEDVLKYIYPEMKEEKKALWLKFLVAAYGVLAVFVALAITFSSGLIIQIISVVSSCLQGPAAGLFFMGAFVPWVNWKGAGVGGITGFFFGLWLVIGSFFSKIHWQPLPTTTANCSAEAFQNISSTISTLYDCVNSTEVTTAVDGLSTIMSESVSVSGISILYNISFMWKREVVSLFTVSVALIISFITGFRKPRTIPPHLVHSTIRRFVGKDITKDDVEFKEQFHTEAIPGYTEKEMAIKEKEVDVTST